VRHQEDRQLGAAAARGSQQAGGLGMAGRVVGAEVPVDQQAQDRRIGLTAARPSS
jgi:hypothetical protein